MRKIGIQIFVGLCVSQILFAQAGGPFPSPNGRPGNCGVLSGADGRLKSQTLSSAGVSYVTCYGWDNRGNLLSTVDPRGFLTDFSYDWLDRMTLSRDVLGDERTPSYIPNQQMSSLLEPIHNSPNPNLPVSKTTSWSYDSFGNPLSSSVVGGETVRQHYDSDFQRKAAVAPDGHLAAITTYQSFGRLGTQGVAEVDGQGNIVSETLGRKKYWYNDNGQWVGVTNGAGNRWDVTVDPMGRLKEQRGPDGTKFVFGYDDASRVIWQEVRDAQGVMLERIDWAYDVVDRVTQIQHTKAGDADVWKTTWSYFLDGKTVIESSMLNNQQFHRVTRYYDSLYRQTSTAIPLFGTWNYTYESGGKLDQITHDSLGLQEDLDYDPMGRVKTVRDALGNATNVEYDSQMHPVKKIPPVGDMEILYYNIDGRLVQTNIGTWNIQTLYDGAGRFQKWQTSELSGPTYAYRIDTGLVQTVTLPTNGQYVVTQRDADGRLTNWTDPNGTAFILSYDTHGRPKVLQAGTGTSARYREWRYDGRGRVTVVGESTTVLPSTFSQFTVGPTNPPPPYDPNLISVVRLSYSANGSVKEENQWIAGVWYPVTSTFSAGGNGLQVSTTYPSTLRADRTTNLAGKIITLRGDLNAQTIIKADYFYANNIPGTPRLDLVKYNDFSLEGEFIYDSNLRVTQYQLWRRLAPGGVREEVANLRYKYSPRSEWIARSDHIYPVVGNLVTYSVTQGVNNRRFPAWWSLIDDVTFDQIANNSSAVEGPLAVQRYFYNTAHHRTTISTKDPNAGLTGTATNGTSRFYTIRADNVSQSFLLKACRYSADGLQEWCDPNIPDVSYTFDPDSNGNLRANKVVGAADPTNTFDLLGRLISVTNPAVNKTIKYEYDGLDRLIRRKEIENNNIVMEHHFVWEGRRLVETRRVIGGNQTLNYVYGREGNDLVAYTDGFTTNYVTQHVDGSVALVTSNANVVEWYRYNPFGETRAWKFNAGQVLSVPLTQTVTPRLYLGQFHDSLTGYYFLGSRWFDSNNGHFLEAEKVGL